jgi:hypothetical protein
VRTEKFYALPQERNDKSAILGVHGVALRWHGYSLMDCCDYGIIGNSRLYLYELDFARAARAEPVIGVSFTSTSVSHVRTVFESRIQPRKNLFGGVFKNNRVFAGSHARLNHQTNENTCMCPESILNTFTL